MLNIHVRGMHYSSSCHHDYTCDELNVIFQNIQHRKIDTLKRIGDIYFYDNLKWLQYARDLKA